MLGFIKFFLQCIIEQCENYIAKINRIKQIYNEDMEKIKLLKRNVMYRIMPIMMQQIVFTKKEIEILKTLNFNTNQSTSYQFLTIFHQICFNLLSEQPQTMNYILNMSENYLLLIIKGENSMSISPCEMAMLAINQTLFQLAYTFPNEKNRIIYCAISQVRSIANNYYAKNTEENEMSNNNYFQAVC